MSAMNRYPGTNPVVVPQAQRKLSEWTNGNANPSTLTIPYIGTNYVGNLLSSPQATNMENQSSLRFFAANPGNK
jgi:hypothetical protein